MDGPSDGVARSGSTSHPFWDEAQPRRPARRATRSGVRDRPADEPSSCGRLDAVKVRIAATNVADLLQRAAERTPDKAALVHRSGRESDSAPTTLTWRELDDAVDAVARGLARRGLVGGQRVAINLTNAPEFVVSYLATLRAGMVAVPVNPGSTSGEVSRMLADSGARLCFADAMTVADRARCASRERGPDRAGRLRRRTGAGRRDGVRRPGRRRPGRDEPARHGGPRGPALHVRDEWAAARRDAQPPRPAGEHRPGLADQARTDPE